MQQISKVSVFLDRETHAEAKAAATRAGIPLTKYVSNLVARELKRSTAKRQAREVKKAEAV